MKLISHRANLSGTKPEFENSPKYIQEALNFGLDVEIDVWFVKNQLFLGHDEPQYEIDLDYLKNEKFWCHAKNPDALRLMLDNEIHCFWHDKDKFTLTSKGIPWCYPQNHINGGVVVFQDLTSFSSVSSSYSEISKNLHGICSDYICDTSHGFCKLVDGRQRIFKKL